MLQTVKTYCTFKNAKTLLIALCIVAFYLCFGCPIRLLFGVCCPGCGMTRAALALLHFDFTGAWHFHPLIFVMPVFAVLFIAMRKRLSDKAVYIMIAGFLMLLLAVYLYRLLTHSDVVYFQVERSLLVKIYYFIRQYI